MKKTFKFLGLSVLVLGLAVACNNNQPVEEEVIDSPEVVEDVIEEETVVDSALIVEEPEATAPVVEKKKTATAKKTNNNNATATAVATADANAGVKVDANVKISNTKGEAVEANTEVVKENDLNKKATKAKKKLK